MEIITNLNLENVLKVYSKWLGHFWTGNGIWLWAFNTENMDQDKELDTCWLQIRHLCFSFWSLWYQCMMSTCSADPGKEFFQDPGLSHYEIIIFLRVKCNFETLLKTKIYYSKIYCLSMWVELKTLNFQRVSKLFNT